MSVPAGNSGDASARTRVVPDLAVVIPAYKARFLDEALASIAAQDDRGFLVYVGDDASPEDVAGVCRKWEAHLPLRYCRFEVNLGGLDLVAQWERCIALSSEPWIWLFSDDDVMEPRCVSAWRAARAARPRAGLFHFDVLRIDADGRPLCNEPAFPPRTSARRFLLQRLLFQISSYAPDYIFSRSAYEAVHGFQPFPLAWGSDDATWIKLAGQADGIHAIPGARVHWRLSGSNISSRGGGGYQAGAKLEASVQFLEWMETILPALPMEADDPADETLFRAGARWLYRQARYVDGQFRQLGMLQLASRLGKLKTHGTAASLLRMIQADGRSAWRALVSRRPTLRWRGVRSTARVR